MSTTSLPRYRCHKEVEALKLQQVSTNPNGSIDLFPEDRTYDPINLEGETAQRVLEAIRSYSAKTRGGSDLGYLVTYADGYQSWSPTKAFEEGYTLIGEESNETSNDG